MNIFVARLLMLFGGLYLLIMQRKLLFWFGRKCPSFFISSQFAAAIIQGLFVIPLILFIVGYALWGLGAFIFGLL